MRAELSDPLRLNHSALSVSYSPDPSLPGRERVHVGAEYRRYDWEAHAIWNGAADIAEVDRAKDLQLY